MRMHWEQAQSPGKFVQVARYTTVRIPNVITRLGAMSSELLTQLGDVLAALVRGERVDREPVDDTAVDLDLVRSVEVQRAAEVLDVDHVRQRGLGEPQHAER